MISFLKQCVLVVVGFMLLLGPAHANKKQVIENLAAIMNVKLTESQISATPIDGLYQVAIGAQIIYISKNGQFLIQGNLHDLDRQVNLTSIAQGKFRLKALEAVSEEEMVVFKAKNERHKVTIFSDIDCGYCRKLHAEIGGYLDNGITVRYLFMPRSGVDTPSYHKAVSVWCADDRRKALTDSKLGKTLERKTCVNPVRKHMALSESFGVSGTPAIITSSGRIIPGYVPANKLLAELAKE